MGTDDFVRAVLEAARLAFAAAFAAFARMFEPSESLIEIVTMLRDMGMLPC